MEVTMDKVEAVAYKKKREVRRVVRSWKAKVLAVLIGVGLFIACLLIAFYNISQWYDKNKVTFQTPVQIRPAVLIEARKEQVATSSAIVQSMPITDQYLPILNELYRKIRWNESNAGMSKKDMLDLHNYCQSVGKVNELGWIPKKGEKFCFADYEEQWKTFKGVFESRLKVMTVNEALCVHNTGIKQPMCLFSMEIDKIK